VELPACDLTHLTGLTGEVPLQANSEEPVPLKTEFFEGRMLLMLRPVPGDPRPWPHEAYFRRQSERGEKMVVELMLQGKFLKEPVGDVWFGGEIEDNMNLGFGMMATARFLLSFIRKVAKMPLHYSFGSGSGANRERAHIVQPLAKARVMETPGDAPWPELGPSLRVNSTPDLTIRKGPVYTFAYNCNCIDFNTWDICNVPGAGRIGLRNFWGNSPLHLIIYDTEAEEHQVKNRRLMLDVKLTSTKIVVPVPQADATPAAATAAVSPMDSFDTEKTFEPLQVSSSAETVKESRQYDNMSTSMDPCSSSEETSEDELPKALAQVVSIEAPPPVEQPSLWEMLTSPLGVCRPAASQGFCYNGAQLGEA